MNSWKILDRLLDRHHPLPSVLTILLMGVLAGADGPAGISRWAVAKKNLLVQALDLPHGLPSRAVIRRILSALKVDAFQSSIACWLNSLRDAAKEKACINAEETNHMAIDGKTMRRRRIKNSPTYDRGEFSMASTLHFDSAQTISR